MKEFNIIVLGGGPAIAVYNVGGTFYATQHDCTHEGGPLSEGDLEGNVITCPSRRFRFDVTNGWSSECRPENRCRRSVRP